MFGFSLSSLDPGLFVLFSLLSGIRGDCGAPPKLKNAIPNREIKEESFRSGQTVTYKCLDGFYNIHGKLDVVTCLPESRWTFIGEFCERSCISPPKSMSAKRKLGPFTVYYVAKSTVTYVCRPGYDSIPGINPVVTCLENYTWTAVPDFCKGKSCGDPGKPENGEAVLLTNFLYLAKVNFTCGDGYILNGSSSIQCIVKGTGVEWETKPPECQQITCFSPPNITNASHDGGSTGNFPYNSTVTYKCDHGFSLMGEASIHCTTEDKISGVWRGSTPECKATTLATTTLATTTLATTTLATSMPLTIGPMKKDGNPSGPLLGVLVGIPALLVMAALCAVAVALRQKGKSSYTLNQETAKCAFL